MWIVGTSSSAVIVHRGGTDIPPAISRNTSGTHGFSAPEVRTTLSVLLIQVLQMYGSYFWSLFCAVDSLSRLSIKKHYSQCKKLPYCIYRNNSNISFWFCWNMILTRFWNDAEILSVFTGYLRNELNISQY